MPRLILLRHARAERARPGITDHQRKLTKAGERQSDAAGRAIGERGDRIDLVLSSDSERTRGTWKGAKPHVTGKPEVRFLRSLYDASGSYLPVLQAEGGDSQTILIVSHNPTIHETAVQLASDLAGEDGRSLADGFPKAAFAVLEFDGAWKTLRPRSMRLVAFIMPEDD